MEARTNDVCSRPVLIRRQLTPHPPPTKRGDTGGTPQNTASTIRLPTNNPPRPHRPRWAGTGHGCTTAAHNCIHSHHCDQISPPPRRHRRGRAGGDRVTAVIAWGKRPVPSRTRKLRPTAPMVLHPPGCGRVGHRRTTPTRVEPPHPPVRGLPTSVERPRTHRCGGSPHQSTGPAPTGAGPFLMPCAPALPALHRHRCGPFLHSASRCLWSPTRRRTAARPSGVPGQCRSKACGPAVRATERSTRRTITASSA